MRVIGKGTAVTVTASLLGDRTSGVTVTEDFVPAEENRQPCDPVRLEAALKKTGATPYTVEFLQINGSFDMFMKVSEMNGLRRRVLEALSEHLAWHRERPYVYYDPLPQESVPQAVEYYYQDWDSFWHDVVGASSDDRSDDETGSQSNRACDGMIADLPKVYVIPVSEYERHFSELSELNIQVLPYVSNVTRGREEAFLEEHFDSIADHCRERGIYIGTLGWIAPFRSAGVPVFADFGLNVYNQAARDCLAAMGVRFCADSLECMTPGNGRYPLMTLQHEPAGDILETPRRGPLRIVRRSFSDQTVLAADSPDTAAEPFAGDMVRLYR
jgi:putative protease